MPGEGDEHRADELQRVAPVQLSTDASERAASGLARVVMTKPNLVILLYAVAYLSPSRITKMVIQ